jgi:hypothetical protein
VIEGYRLYASSSSQKWRAGSELFEARDVGLATKCNLSGRMAGIKVLAVRGGSSLRTVKGRR